MRSRGCSQTRLQRSQAPPTRPDGDIGLGNHYLEVQKIAEIFDDDIATVFGLHEDEVVVAIHCGSAGWATRSAPTTCAR